MSQAAKQLAVSSVAITEDQFAGICALPTEPKHAVQIIGCRVSDSLAFILSFHLRQVPQGVHHLTANVEAWSGYLLRMKRAACCSRLIFVAISLRSFASVRTPTDGARGLP